MSQDVLSDSFRMGSLVWLFPRVPTMEGETQRHSGRNMGLEQYESFIADIRHLVD